LKTFPKNTKTTPTALIIVSLAYITIYPVSIVAADTEANLSVADWQLTVTGLVETPLTLNWTEIKAMPTSTVDAAIICVDFPGTIVTEGEWTGVKLRTVLEASEPSDDAIKVAFYADDGYSTDLTVEAAMCDDVIIAYEKDSSTLDSLRLVVPDKWGYKWISQLTRIELVDYNFLGF
jgi:DMSO/TMAO reductase YedYZ molybdopterin-dependent catalytic subunit